MKLNPIKWLLNDEGRKPPALLAVTPPRTGERTLLGVENMLGSIAVPEPFSLELAGDMDGVTLLARCLEDQVVRGQIAARYPQAQIQEIPAEDDPLRLDEDEQAWSMTLRADGPEYVPLRTFRDDDLLDPGSDPLISLMGALSNLNEGERIVARLMLRSMGPDWSESHLEKAHKRPVEDRRDPSYTYQTRPLQTDGVTMAVLGVAALAALRGYLWVQAGETWKAVLMGVGVATLLTAGGWAWHRFKKAKQAGLRPDPHQGEGLPHRLRRRDSGDGDPARRHGAAARQGASRDSGRRLPRLRQPPQGRGSRGAASGPPCPTPRCFTPQAPACSGSAASWGCARRPACGTRPERGTRRPWWPAPGPGCCCPRPAASAAAPTSATPPRERRGRFTSPPTCCGDTTSTWPAPAWASPP